MISDNDLRGWIMSAVSGAACVLGAAVICVDLLLRRLSLFKGFQIANSNGFLSASLCLSAGVMIFTSLYSMLPTSKRYLTRAGLSPRMSAFALTGLFLAGVVVIRIVSTLIHHYIPSHVVGCAHTHGLDSNAERGEAQCHGHSKPDDRGKAIPNGSTENTPLLGNGDARSSRSLPEVTSRRSAGHIHRVSFRSRFERSINLLMGGVKPMCDNNGPCYGFSQACGYECRKTSTPKLAPLDEEARPSLPQHRSIAVQLGSDDTANDEAATLQAVRNLSAQFRRNSPATSSDGNEQPGDIETPTPEPRLQCGSMSSSETDTNDSGNKADDDTDISHKHPSAGTQHHHHVPQNAFLSIGLQTLVAIALHKLPEGFITYATNHANPTLGMSVFLALFIHNISEGFAMALPLYLALYSRWKAIFWSSILGGFSQPAGAGLAALWIYAAQRAGGNKDTTTEPSWGVYGCMFAATAGVMTSVALQLFSEGLALTHNRGLGIGFAIAGMGLMGLSFALTA